MSYPMIVETNEGRGTLVDDFRLVISGYIFLFDLSLDFFPCLYWFLTIKLKKLINIFFIIFFLLILLILNLKN